MIENKLELLYIDDQLSHGYLSDEFVQSRSLKTLYGPSNLKWKKTVNFKNPLEYLSESSQKKINQAYQFAFNEMGFTQEFHHEISKADFIEWYELYKTNMSHKDVFTINVTPDSFDQKDPKPGAILVRDKSKKMIGGVITTLTKQSISCGYRAHEYIHIKKSSLAAVLEYLIDYYALMEKKTIIYRGTDPNLYGIRLGPGLHDFKQQYGFVPYSLDYTVVYVKRHLVFFKPYEDILTYVYDDSAPQKISPLRLNAEQLKQYTYNIADLNL